MEACGRCSAYMANLPLDANVQVITVMATQMPLWDEDNDPITAAPVRERFVPSPLTTRFSNRSFTSRLT